MTNPRKHVELAIKYFSDSENKCWLWAADKSWRETSIPIFEDDVIYHVGKEEPTEPPNIMCELAGVQFPMPETKPPSVDCTYYIPDITSPEYPYRCYWGGCDRDKQKFEAGLLHLDRYSAVQHAKALMAANMQAINAAKEMK